MCRTLAACSHTIVATFTGTQYFIVIDNNHRGPTQWGMAGITNIGRIDMVCRFARRCCAIVTGETGSKDFIMINRHNRHPCGGHVTGLANIAR